MVWVHTLRALDRPELRSLGRSMWRELARGFPYVEEVAGDAYGIFGMHFETRGFGKFPTGLTPEPQQSAEA